MSGGWSGSSATDRRDTLPPDWEWRREERKKIDGYRCTEIIEARNGGRFRCSATTDLECDHVGDRHDHRLEMLRTKCKRHHGKKTSRQGNDAQRERKRATRRDRGADGPHRS